MSVFKLEFKFCGFNGFQQFAGCKNKKVVEPTEFEIHDLREYKGHKLLQFSWSFNLYACGKILVFSGFNDGHPSQIKKIKLDNEIKQICSNDKICLILLENDKLFKYDFTKNLLTEVIFRTATNPAVKRSIFGEHLSSNIDPFKLDAITHISCCISEFIAITSDGSVYSLPTKIYQFSSRMKVKDLCSGFEHFLLLNNNGDIYSWGNGSRGQLGHNDLDVVDCPQIINALAGIKIISISAGGWHSSAISAFGDLYFWGNNVNGQLGINVYKTVNLNPSKQIRKRNPTIFHLPEIIDIDCNCSNNKNDNEINNCSAVKVKCGARHSIVQMSCGRIYGSGWNTHNQLGIINEIENSDNVVDKFIPIETVIFSEVSDIICGHWCTIFQLNDLQF